MSEHKLVPQLPGSGGSQDLEAFERSPTLLAGETAGRGGQVRVWGPDSEVRRKEIRRFTIVFPTCLLLPYVLLTLMGVAIHPNLFLEVMPIAMMFPVILGNLRRPSYITTDDMGMGLTTWKGSRAVRWDEVEALEWNGARPVLQIANSKPVLLNLVGYAQTMPEQLRNLIVERAGLHLTGTPGLNWVREPAAIAAPSA
ncbi:MAG: hypothetical protein M3Y56_05340 [Armatimonadota bacterium]|nr:hypothetical protein [Armatimonadota bacterium]